MYPNFIGSLRQLETPAPELISLREVKLVGCIPHGLSRIANLTDLSLRNNGLHGEIPPGVLGGLVKLQNLDL